MDEADAIQRLRATGFHARTRDWSLGHSIFVGLGSSCDSGITLYRHARYIYQEGDVWHVIDCVKADDTFPSLEGAVDHTIAALKLEESTSS